MRYQTSLDAFINKRIIKLFENRVDFSNLVINISLSKSTDYDNYTDCLGVHVVGEAFPIGHIPFPIIRLLGNYNPSKKTITLYLRDIAEISWKLGFYNHTAEKVDFLFRVTLFHLLGRWLCHTLKINGKSSSIRRFHDYGELYKVFVSQMIAYHILELNDKKLFIEFSKHLKYDYFIFTHFVRDFRYPESPKKDEVSIKMLIDFIDVVRADKEEVSRSFISNYFDKFIHRRISRKPYSIKNISSILTEEQKAYISHLNKDHGFFID